MADIVSVFHTFPQEGVQQLKPAEYDREIRIFLHIFTQIPEHALVKAFESQPDILDVRRQLPDLSLPGFS